MPMKANNTNAQNTTAPPLIARAASFIIAIDVTKKA